MTDICFLDTETIGLHPDAPIWEFACIRTYADGTPEDRVEFFIRHDKGVFWDDYPMRFRLDYEARLKPSEALAERTAASVIDAYTSDAIIVGCNPGFDIERLTKILQRNEIEPRWHYHPLDVASVALGFLAGRGRLPEQPWKSDHLADAVGVVTADYERHTAMADTEWVYQQWRSMMVTSQKIFSHGCTVAREIYPQYQKLQGPHA